MWPRRASISTRNAAGADAPSKRRQWKTNGLAASPSCRAFRPAIAPDRTERDFNGKMLIDEIREYLYSLLIGFGTSSLSVR
jgi:hypothetical protein